MRLKELKKLFCMSGKPPGHQGPRLHTTPVHHGHGKEAKRKNLHAWLSGHQQTLDTHTHPLPLNLSPFNLDPGWHRMEASFATSQSSGGFRRWLQPSMAAVTVHTAL